MRIITRQAEANTAAERWRRQYRHDPSGVGERLAALGLSPSPDDVDVIIGNVYWTAVPKCDECGKDNLPEVMQIGEPPDHESSTAYVCRECLRNALAILEEAKK